MEAGYTVEVVKRVAMKVAGHAAAREVETVAGAGREAETEAVVAAAAK